MSFIPKPFDKRAAKLIEIHKGAEAKTAFVNACFDQQDSFRNDALGDARPSKVDAIFADIAQQANIFDNDTFTREYFLQHLNDWDEIVKPSHAEVKVALEYGVFGTPKFVIDEKLVENTESAWGPDEWEAKIAELDGQN